MSTCYGPFACENFKFITIVLVFVGIIVLVAQIRICGMCFIVERFPFIHTRFLSFNVSPVIWTIILSIDDHRLLYDCDVLDNLLLPYDQTLFSVLLLLLVMLESMLILGTDYHMYFKE